MQAATRERAGQRASLQGLSHAGLAVIFSSAEWPNGPWGTPCGRGSGRDRRKRINKIGFYSVAARGMRFADRNVKLCRTQLTQIDRAEEVCPFKPRNRPSCRSRFIHNILNCAVDAPGFLEQPHVPPARRHWTVPLIYRTMRGWLFPYVRSRVFTEPCRLRSNRSPTP